MPPTHPAPGSEPDYGANSRRPDGSQGDSVTRLMEQATALLAAGVSARAGNDEPGASKLFDDALAFALNAAELCKLKDITGKQIDALLTGARCAACSGHADTVREIIDSVSALGGDFESGEWAQLRDIDLWPDEWLVAAVRRNPPDERALDVLAQRYWKKLFARCQMLTVDREKAADLAQEAWCRVLRGRGSLKPGGNFPAYLAMIATNLWRDQHRSSLRAGEMAASRMTSLDLEAPSADGTLLTLAEAIPDLPALEAEARAKLKLDLDDALARLTPLSRDILVARFIDGESCAEIGRRYERTEQTISGWLRRAIQDMKSFLREAPHGAG